MAELKFELGENAVKLGSALVSDGKLRLKFDTDPVGVLKEYGFSLPDDLTNEKLREVTLLKATEECERSDKAQLGVVAAVEVGVEAAMTPYTYPVTMVVVGVAVCTTVIEKSEE